MTNIARTYFRYIRFRYINFKSTFGSYLAVVVQSQNQILNFHHQNQTVLRKAATRFTVEQPQKANKAEKLDKEYLNH